MFKYPSTSLDQPELLLNQLGSLWATTYAGSDLVLTLCAAKLAQQRQTFRNGRELVDACDRLLVPVLHTEEWFSLELKESEHNESDYSLIKFDGTIDFTDPTPYQFDVPVSTPLHAWKLPTDVSAVPLLFNRITTPSLTLADGIDYTLSDGFVVFRDNPFADDLVPKTTIFKDNVAVDRTITLWAFRATFDRAAIQEQFGYVLDMDLDSEPAARDLMNALFDSLVLGSTNMVIRQAWSAITGIPLAKGDETVELILEEATRTVVITDKNVYSYKPAVAVTAAVGDTVIAGDVLTDGLQFFEFNRGQTPSYDDVKALALGRGFLAAGFFGDLVFKNESTPLIVETDADGFTRLSWEIGGWPGDITLFFDDLHARGLATGVTLANLLDQRPEDARDTEPTAGALPATINPLQFLCENILRNNAFLVKVKAGATGNGVGMNAAKFLRRVIPPQTAMLILTELEIDETEITLDGAGDETTPGYEEDVSVFLGMDADDTIGVDMIVEDVKLYLVSGQCV